MIQKENTDEIMVVVWFVAPGIRELSKFKPEWKEISQTKDASRANQNQNKQTNKWLGYESSPQVGWI